MPVLFDLENKIITIYLTFTKKLTLSTRFLDIGAEKINGTMLDIYEMIAIALSVTDK